MRKVSIYRVFARVLCKEPGIMWITPVTGDPAGFPPVVKLVLPLPAFLKPGNPAGINNL